MIFASPSDASIDLKLNLWCTGTANLRAILTLIQYVEEMGEGGVLELEAPLKIAEITVEVSRV